jgi:transposase-like protein
MRSIEERRRLVEAYRTSSMSVEQFAEREGVAASTLYGWLRAPQGGTKPTARLARVIVTQTRATSVVDDAPVLLEYGGVRMSVRRGFDRRVLADVLSVLEQRR